jgi:general secretion pathway protein J
MMENVDPRDGEAGFTLVELLVALALFSLLCSLLFGNVRFGMKAWQSGAAHAEQIDHTMVVQGLFRRMIEEAYPLFITDDPTHPHIDFNGREKSLEFISFAPTAAGLGARYRFIVTTDQRDARTDLVMISRRELAIAADSSTSTRTDLLTDVEGVEFSYFGMASSDQAALWHTSWLQQSAMPQLVRIRARLHPGDPRPWPDLLVAPRISADVSCVYDALTKRCRGR